MTEPPSTPQGSGPDWGDMAGKLKGAQGPDRLILIAGLLFLIDSFLPWYGICIGQFGCHNSTGWGSGGWAVLATLFALLALALAVVRNVGAKVNLGTVKDGVLYLVFGGGAFVFALLRWITATNFTKFGLYLGIVLGAILAVGGWQKYKAESGK